ncbi:MAG: ATP-dependent sacrificial sulfur transferase LarE [Nitrospinota bacterium]|nr:ATP-dependent sacrificial sulfur transferase LarE [Nitrospinota bacterium]
MLLEKRQRLETRLCGLGSVVVAFSGGVDSALILVVAHSVLGPKVVAVTAQSESLPERELKAAKRLAREIGVEHLVIQTDEMSSFEYRENSTDRCYHCKSELYTKLQAIAQERNFDHIVNGINTDDMGDHRPGILAANEAGVLSPLRDAGFSKEDIRSLSRELGLAVWEKPAAACLSSRIPYNQPISQEKLSMVEKAEDFLLSIGFTQVRVRHHGDIARIELLKEEMSEFFNGGHSYSTQKRFKELGFKYITLDIEGFRSGSLNEVLQKD